MKKSNRLLILLPRGETIRNFLYSGIIANLRKEHLVTLISVKPNEEIWSLLKENSDELIELKHIANSYKYKFFIEIFDLAHNRYVWSEAAKVRWNMRDVEADTTIKKVKRFLKKSIAQSLANQHSMVTLEKIDNWLASKEKNTNYWKDILKSKKYKLVFNTSHSHAKNALPVVYAANQLNIKTCTFLFSWDNLTSQGRVLPRYEKYFSWNSKIKEDFHNIYPHIDKNQVVVTGTPQFINHFNIKQQLTKEELYYKLGLKLEDKYFLYSSGMSNHMPYEPYVVERIADIIYKINPKLKLVVRTYAKDRLDVFDELKEKRKDIIIPKVAWEKKYQTPLIEDQEFFIALMKNCIAGINVASTISLELCMLNKPAINVGYNPPNKNIYPYNYTRFYSFDHYKPIVDSGAVQVAKDENEIEDLLREALINPSKLEKERKQLIADFFENIKWKDVINNFMQQLKSK
ncbi:MAG: hypothetical protein H6604_01050 [Flavobacteriales bacterium]|nr:hypothetical protein [Flavobacteriales bacterium]